MDEVSAMVAATIRLTLIIVSTAAYFGLAILGWGGLAAFLSHPALIALTVELAGLVGAALCAGGNLSAGVREDRGNRWVIAVFALIGLLEACLPAYTDRKEFWTIDGDTIRWVGVVLFAAGGALRLCTAAEMSLETCTRWLLYVRFHGKNRENWFKRNITAAERFKYLYSEAPVARQRIRQSAATRPQARIRDLQQLL